MDNKFIESNIRRCSRNFLIINIGLSIFVAYIIYLLFWDYYNMLLGPFELDNKIIAILTDKNVKTEFKKLDVVYTRLSDNFEETVYSKCFVVDKKYYFKINADNLIDSGFKYVLSETNGTYEEDVGDVFFVPIKNKYIILQTPTNSNKKVYNGILTFYDFNTNELIDANVGKILREDVYPFMLNTLTPFKRIIVLKLILSTIFFMFILYNYYKIIRRVINFKSHPIYDKIGIYGKEEEVIENMNDEVKCLGSSKARTIRTSTWTFKKKLLKLDIERNI